MRNDVVRGTGVAVVGSSLDGSTGPTSDSIVILRHKLVKGEF